MKTDTPTDIPEKWSSYYRALQELLSRWDNNRDDETAASELDTNDMADSATDECDHDMALSLLSREQSARNELVEAMRRIKNGSYGICEGTQKRISAARLRAIPWARHCKEEQDRLEKEGVSPVVRFAADARN